MIKIIIVFYCQGLDEMQVIFCYGQESISAAEGGLWSMPEVVLELLCSSFLGKEVEIYQKCQVICKTWKQIHLSGFNKKVCKELWSKWSWKPPTVASSHSWEYTNHHRNEEQQVFSSWFYWCQLLVLRLTPQHPHPSLQWDLESEIFQGGARTITYSITRASLGTWYCCIGDLLWDLSCPYMCISLQVKWAYYFFKSVFWGIDI